MESRSAIQQRVVKDMFDDVFDDLLKDSFSLKDTPEMLYEGGTPPVEVREFVESHKFLNLKGKIYPKIIQCLEKIEQDNIRESYLLLGKGSGKTVALQIYMVYGVYKTLLLKNPQEYFELLPGDSLVSLLVSVSDKQAKEVGFRGITNLIQNSPWFKDKYEILSKEIRFPKNITLYSGHSQATSWLGFNTFRAAIDEMEWLIDSSNRSVSKELYRALKGSLVTRFPNKYKLLCISSTKNDYSPLHTMYKNVRDNGKKVEMGD